jgi:hypothetical protein
MSVSHGDDGDIMQMKARDLTGVLIDTKLPVGEKGTEGVRIQAGDTVQTAVRALLDTNPGFRSFIKGPYLRIAPGSNLKNLDPALYPRISFPPKERHRKKRTEAGETVAIRDPSAPPLSPEVIEQFRREAEGRGYILRYPAKIAGETSYWDAITDLCVTHSFRPTIEQENLVILEPRTLYKFDPEILTQPGVPSFPRPNGHRFRIGDTNVKFRRMVWGDNISVLRFQRKFGRIKVPTIEVQGTDPNAVKDGRRITVRYPPKKRATKVDPSGKKPNEEFHRVTISGIIDRSELLKIAQQTYEEMGRQELGIVISTDEMASFSDNPNFDPNLEPDLLDLRSGDPIRLLVTPAQKDRSIMLSLSELNDLVARVDARVGSEDPVDFLVREGWSREDAIQVIKLLRSASLPNEFRVIAASYRFAEDGFHCEIDARNYVRVRADPDDIANTEALGLAEARSIDPELDPFNDLGLAPPVSIQFDPFGDEFDEIEIGNPSIR